jgi:5-formyltetrahydrofolate cyclo-ligase
VASQQSAGSAPSLGAAKTALRDRLVTSRNRRSLTDVGDAATAIAGHLLSLPEVRRAASVAAYVGVGREPGTGLLLDALLAAGKRVILPLTIGSLTGPDADGLDLDWATYVGSESLAQARFGLLEPTTPALGVDAIATPEVVLVPGLAVSWRGMRLGKGAGCYDRALGRVPVGTFTCVALYDDEVGVEVPVEGHDRPVTAAVSPSGVTRLAG